MREVVQACVVVCSVWLRSHPSHMTQKDLLKQVRLGRFTHLDSIQTHWNLWVSHTIATRHILPRATINGCPKVSSKPKSYVPIGVRDKTILIVDDKNVFTICFWRNIVVSWLQRTFFQLQFWHLRLYIVCNMTYSGRVTLTGHCTYSRSQKCIICIQALPGKRFHSCAGLTSTFSETPDSAH